MKIWLPLLSFLLAPSVYALEVLGVVGSVVPAKPYYEALLSKQPSGESITVNARDISRAKRWAGDYDYDSGLTQGNFQPFALDQEVTKRMTQPLCLIANDQKSHDWLLKSHSVLVEVNAVCYLVKSNNGDDLEALRGLAEGLNFYALDPTLIINKFSVPNYPALISKRGVEQ